ncbi:MAG: hypothetical protein KGZ85_09455 [Ignavibacterium sp.]|nr:hypothetical protein [Ignavibacterium sp.]
MKTAELAKKYFLPFFILALITFFAACQDNSIVDPEVTSDRQAMEKLVEEDSVLNSFEPNFNEDGGVGFLGKVNADIYPFKVWHRMRLVNRNLTIDIQGDTAYGVVTNTFEGILFIAATYDPNATTPDTVVQKPFTSTVTRNIIFVKIDRNANPERNWRIAAISLPEGGTQSPNIDITKFTAFLPNGDTLIITSPNDYYLIRNWQHWWRWRHIPVLQPGQEVLLRVELTSAYSDTDFVTITFGADRFGMHRLKKRFELISSTPNGNLYDKVYEQTFTPRPLAFGFFHAIVNATPKQVIFDDSTPVEMESWGVPYFVRPLP